MSESKFKKAQTAKVPDEFICPISQTIMREPVFNEEGTTFDRKVIEQWVDKHGTDPFTRKPLSKKDLKPNRALREGLSKKQKEQLQHLNVYQIARLREKELEEIQYNTPSPKKDVSKALRQLQIVKKQLNIQRQQKEFAIRQCQVQKKQAAIDRKKLSACEMQNIKLKQNNQMLQLKLKKNENQIEQSKKQNIKLRNQKDTLKIQCRRMLQQIKTYQKENQVLKKENLELRKLQKRNCQEIQELQKRLKDCHFGNQKHEKLVPRSGNVKITPDKQSRGLMEGNWLIDNTNSSVSIKNTQDFIWNPCNWLCSSALPFDGEFVFTIKVVKLTKVIFIGVMEEDKKGEKWNDTWNYSVYLDPKYQQIRRPNEEQKNSKNIKCSCSSLPQCPFQIECHVNRQQNTIAWHYNGKQQAKSTLLKAWKTNKKSLCAIVKVYYKGECVEMM